MNETPPTMQQVEEKPTERPETQEQIQKPSTSPASTVYYDMEEFGDDASELESQSEESSVSGVYTRTFPTPIRRDNSGSAAPASAPKEPSKVGSKYLQY